MLDIKIIRENPQKIANLLKIKHFNFDIEYFNLLEENRKKIQIEKENLEQLKNQNSKKIGELKRQGIDIKDILESNDNIKKNLHQLKIAFENNKKLLNDFLLKIPNIPDQSVPEGNNEENNVLMYHWGTPKTFNFKVLDHVDLGEKRNDIDFKNATKMTGSRFVVMHHNMAQLHRALIQFMLNEHTLKNNYDEIYVPYIVNKESLLGTGQLPKFEKDLFKLEHENDYYLIPTAEVPVTNMVRDTIFNEKDLPLKFVAHTPCFRSEAGAYGKDTRGMIRQHQFDKVELVQIVKKENADKTLEEITQHAESILQALELPYRKVLLCGGDLGFSAQKTYDLEVWLPSQNTYREISSCSNMGDFQARRMMARCKDSKTNNIEYLTTLNGSGVAIGRALVAIIENNQLENGDIVIPEVLKPYLNNRDII